MFRKNYYSFGATPHIAGFSFRLGRHLEGMNIPTERALYDLPQLCGEFLYIDFQDF
jgi:hypothetical protein